MPETKKLMIQILNDTLNQIDDLQRILNAPSKSDVIRRAVDLLHLVADGMQNGDRLLLDNKYETVKILIPGLSQTKHK